MRISLRGGELPESEEDYNLLLSSGGLRFKRCCFCGQPHVGRTHTSLGWAETQISGSCENCFDEMFEEK